MFLCTKEVRLGALDSFNAVITRSWVGGVTQYVCSYPCRAKIWLYLIYKVLISMGSYIVAHFRRVHLIAHENYVLVKEK